MAENEVRKVDDSEGREKIKGVKKNPPWPLITIGIVGTVVVLALIVGGWVFIRSQTQEPTGDRFGSLNQTDRSSGQRAYRNNRGSGPSNSNSGMMNANAVRGVVTAINGNTLVVSGSGKQVTVKQTSSTAISGDKTSVAVNDTVVIVGDTASDGTVTATRILIRNQTAFDGASAEDGQDNSSDAPSV